MTRQRLAALRFPKDVVDDVARLVELHLRFHGYAGGTWTDAAVRRYVRDAGPLLSRLHQLTRSDCTTRNIRKAKALASAYDSLERRIEELAAGRWRGTATEQGNLDAALTAAGHARAGLPGIEYPDQLYGVHDVDRVVQVGYGDADVVDRGEEVVGQVPRHVTHRPTPSGGRAGTPV